MFTLFQRVNAIINANVNDLLDRIEDPERMIKQIIREMEENITQAKEDVVAAITSEKQLQRELESHRTLVEQWREKAETALTAGKEDLARAALVRKKEYEAIVANLEPAWASAHTTSTRLKNQLKQLEDKLEEAKHKRSALLARQRASEAQRKMRDTAARFQTGLDTSARFARMEDKVAEMEANAAAWAELENSQNALDKEFEELEIDQEVEDELAELKAKLGKR